MLSRKNYPIGSKKHCALQSRTVSTIQYEADITESGLANPKFCANVILGANRAKFIHTSSWGFGCLLFNSIRPVRRDFGVGEDVCLVCAI